MLRSLFTGILAKLLSRETITELYVEQVVYPNHKTALAELFGHITGKTDDLGKRIHHFDSYAVERLCQIYGPAELIDLVTFRSVSQQLNRLMGGEATEAQLVSFFNKVVEVRDIANPINKHKEMISLVEANTYCDTDSIAALASTLIQARSISAVALAKLNEVLKT